MKDYKNVKDFLKAFLIAIGILSSPVAVFYLIVGVGMLYDAVFVHHEYKFRFFRGETYNGAKCLGIYRGDTVIMYPKNQWVTCETEGKFFHFHKSDGIVETKFIKCDYNGFIVPHYVSDFKGDLEFMIADQKPLDSIFGKEIAVYDENGKFLRRIRPNDPHNLKIEYQMLDESPIHQFWIIALRTADVYGPLSYEEYIQKRTELGVAPELRLKCEKSLEE